MSVYKPNRNLKDFSKVVSLKDLGIFEALYKCLSYEVPLFAFTSAYFIDPDVHFFEGACNVRTDCTSLTFPLITGSWDYLPPDFYEVSTKTIESLVHLELKEFGAYDYKYGYGDTWEVSFSPHTDLLKYNTLIGVPSPDSPFDMSKGCYPQLYKTENLYIRNSDLATLIGEASTPAYQASDYSERLPDINLKKLHSAIIDTLIEALKKDASDGRIDHSFKLKSFPTDSTNTFNSKALARAIHDNSIKYFQNADQYKVNTISEKINDILKKYEK